MPDFRFYPLGAYFLSVFQKVRHTCVLKWPVFVLTFGHQQNPARFRPRVHCAINLATRALRCYNVALLVSEPSNEVSFGQLVLTCWVTSPSLTTFEQAGQNF